ncbi:hypothetical protein BV20DRAFT_1116221 [Pilatotrama ljubarskyi]|nr:hypothetical protein BV20DRAFT_1116221 [Pilatotrama ljubarskyi]
MAPPYGAGPRPKPRRLPNVIYQSPRGRAVSLQEQMGLQDDAPKLVRLVALIRHVAADHIALHIPYNRQDRRQLQEIKTEILRKSSVLRTEYVDGWPIDAYLRVALKRHNLAHRAASTDTPRPRRRREEVLPYNHPRRGNRGNDRPTILTRATTKRFYRPDQSETARPTGYEQGDERMTAYADRPGADRVSPSRGVDTARGSRSTSVGATTPGSRDSTSPESEHGTEEPNVCSDDRDSEVPEPAPGVSSTELESCELLYPSEEELVAKSEPDPASDSPHALTERDLEVRRTNSPPPRLPTPASMDFAGMLRARILPEADATRIAQLFTAFGVSDAAYMRVFSRMSSRDAWLRELRERGRLSEIQMLVVRDVLETVEAQTEG